MKTSTKTKLLTLIAVGALSVFNAKSQTALSGSASNGCTPAAGTGGVVSNTSVGCGAGNATMTGGINTFVGDSAGHSCGSGSNNSGVGYKALKAITSGGYNSALGDIALQVNTTGNYNTACGAYSLLSNKTGSNNVAVGLRAINTDSSGNDNTAVGYEALYSTNTSTLTNSGSQNTAIGLEAGYSNTTGFNNTYVGYLCNAGAGTYTNSAAFGANSSTIGNDKMYFGNASVIGCYNAAGLWTTSDSRFKTNVKESVKGLEFIKKLRPVTYNLDTKKLDDFLTQNMSGEIKAKHTAGMNFETSTAIVHSGFIAQEVEAAAKQTGFSSSIVSAPATSSEPYAVNYAEIVVPMVKAIQEQQAMIEKQQQQIEDLKKLIAGPTTSNPGTSSTTGINNISTQLSDADVVVLNQNQPNPFAEQTVITYSVPQTANSAQILFYDINGKQIKSQSITSKGNGALTVYAGDLSNGSYSYTLVIDGKVIDTKKMLKQQ